MIDDEMLCCSSCQRYRWCALPLVRAYQIFYQWRFLLCVAARKFHHRMRLWFSV